MRGTDAGISSVCQCPQLRQSMLVRRGAALRDGGDGSDTAVASLLSLTIISYVVALLVPIGGHT